MNSLEDLVNLIVVGGFLTFGLAATGYLVKRMVESNADMLVIVAVAGFAVFVIGVAAAKMLSRMV